MQNYDMMRSMTLEQMAATMMCPNESGLGLIECDHGDEMDCASCCRTWLKQPVSSCRVCGCTAVTPCPGGCSWAAPDLCSRCAAQQPSCLSADAGRAPRAKDETKIGGMASPFLNDPCAIVALAFTELYPDKEYHAQYVPELSDDAGGAAYGETCFPDDGGIPVISISAEAPVAAGAEAAHGEAWEAANEAIFQKYNELVDEMIPDEEEFEVTLTPHKPGDGGILCMPMEDNIPEPKNPEWRLMTCPVCGAGCWETAQHRAAWAAEPGLRAACTMYALKAGLKKGQGDDQYG